LARIKIGAISEQSDYTGIIAFHKKQCSMDFLNKLNQGLVQVDLVDQDSSYKIEYNYLGQEGSHTNVVVQFRHTACQPKEGAAKAKCLGSNSIDQADLIVMGLDNVNFGNKNIVDCVTNARIGYLGVNKNDIHLADTDISPCVSWTNKYWTK